MVNCQSDKPLLYVIECGEYYKVGISSNIRRRMKDMELHNPYPLKLAAYRYIPGDRIRFIEAAVHLRLKSHAVGREWFKADLQNIRATVDLVIAEDKAKYGWQATRDAFKYKNRVERLLTISRHTWQSEVA